MARNNRKNKQHFKNYHYSGEKFPTQPENPNISIELYLKQAKKDGSKVQRKNEISHNIYFSSTFKEAQKGSQTSIKKSSAEQVLSSNFSNDHPHTKQPSKVLDLDLSLLKTKNALQITEQIAIQEKQLFNSKLEQGEKFLNIESKEELVENNISLTKEEVKESQKLNPIIYNTIQDSREGGRPFQDFSSDQYNVNFQTITFGDAQPVPQFQPLVKGKWIQVRDEEQEQRSKLKEFIFHKTPLMSRPFIPYKERPNSSYYRKQKRQIRNSINFENSCNYQPYMVSNFQQAYEKHKHTRHSSLVGQNLADYIKQMKSSSTFKNTRNMYINQGNSIQKVQKLETEQDYSELASMQKNLAQISRDNLKVQSSQQLENLNITHEVHTPSNKINVQEIEHEGLDLRNIDIQRSKLQSQQHRRRPISHYKQQTAEILSQNSNKVQTTINALKQQTETFPFSNQDEVVYDQASISEAQNQYYLATNQTNNSRYHSNQNSNFGYSTQQTVRPTLQSRDKIRQRHRRQAQSMEDEKIYMFLKQNVDNMADVQRRKNSEAFKMLEDVYLKISNGMGQVFKDNTMKFIFNQNQSQNSYVNSSRIEPMSKERSQERRSGMRSRVSYHNSVTNSNERSIMQGEDYNLRWRKQLRMEKENEQKQDFVENIEKYQQEQIEIKYQKYLSEVKALNLVKEYLSENRKSLNLLTSDLHEELGESLKLDLPEALPIYSPHKKLNSEEPVLKYKINRLMKKTKKGDKDGIEETQENKIEEFKKPLFCRHPKVTDHVCEDCREKIISSGNLFDTGNVGIYINIKYVNEFESNDDQELDLKKFTPVIYENYKPKNSHEMREYMLFVLNKSLQKLQKYETQVPSICAQFGSIGRPMTLSEELKTYLCIKKTRELQVLGIEKNQEQDQEIKIGPNCLLFDSIFESGNLERVEYIKQTEYNLYLNVDTNTKGHQQWFYFKVKNTRKGKKYIFNIKNFTKPFSLHRQGMQIMMKSKKQGNKDWIPAGYNISYSKSDVQRSGWRIPGPLNLDDEEDDDQILDDIQGVDGMNLADQNKKGKQRNSIINNLTQTPNIGAKKRKRYFYCLTFEIEFEHDNDHVYFAYSTPYQYSSIFYHMLQLEQNLIDNHQKEADFKFSENFNQVERIIQTNDIQYERKLLCKTISGLPVPYITVTSRRNKGEDFKKRKAICITSRVHPGETNSNFVFDGFFENLIDYTNSYQLLNHFIFKLIPCLNPDGVICGNYRSSLAGVDLNRQWILPNKDLHPTIYYTKEMLSQISKERQLLVFCDLHCHSKKKNSFIYGCNTAANGGFTSWTKVRLLPRILAKLTALFSIKDCRFRIDPSKLGTARVIVWKEFGVTNSFTLENSFYGFQIAKKVERFIPDLYKEIGENLLRSMNEYRVLMKQIEKEVALTNGWLKPKLLLEITGTPAAEKIAKELEQKQKDERRRKLIEEYKLNMGLIEEPEPEFKTNIKFNLSKVEAKSRNLYIGQTDSQENNKLYKKIDLMPQNTNKSEKVFNLEGLKKESSSESTTIRRNTVFSQDDAKIRQRFIDFPLTPDQLEKVKLIQNKVKSYLRTPKRQVKGSSNNTDTHLDKFTPHLRKSSCGDFQIKMDQQIEVDQNQNSRKQRSKSCHDWRFYFEQEELESAYDQIEKGEDPNEEENISVSDDCASEDNFEMDDLYKDIYLREGTMKKELQMRQKAEKQYLEEIKELIEENFSDNHNDSQEQNPHQTLEFNQTPMAIRKIPNITNVLPLERSQIKEGLGGLNQTQNSIQVSRSFSKDIPRQSQERRPKETMVKLLNVLASSSNRRKTFDPVLHQKSFNQGGREQKSFIITSNAINHQTSSDYQSINQGAFKRPSSQLSVNVNGVHVNSQQDTSMDIDVQSIEQKSMERTPVYSKVTKMIVANTPIKIYQQSENVSSLGNHNLSNISNTQNSVPNEYMKQRKQNFQQYLMKNLRYEDARIQNVYTQITHTNKITNPIHSNPSSVKKANNQEFQRLKSRNTQKREDPYRGQIQQFQLIKPHNKLAPQSNIQLPSIAHQNFILNQGRMQQRKAKSKGMRPLALQGHNAFSNQQNRGQFQSNIMSNRSFIQIAQ